MEEAPNITATVLGDGEAVRLSAEGMGDVLITRALNDDGDWIFVLYPDGATVEVSE